VKKIFLLLSVSIGFFAQPLTLEQGTNVLKTHTLELGIDGSYGYDKWTVKSIPGIEYIKTDITLSVIGRYATDDNTEFAFSVPYKMLSGSTTGTGNDSAGGLSDVSLLLKSMVMPYEKGGLSLGVLLDIPTGNSKAFISEGANLGGGLGVGVLVATSRRFGEHFTFGVNGQLKYRGRYINSTDSEIQESPLWFLGFDGQLALGKNLSLIAEAKWTYFNDYKIGGIEQDGTSGNTFNTVYGLRLDTEKFRLKAGVDLSMGDPTFREFSYKVFGTVSFIFEN